MGEFLCLREKWLLPKLYFTGNPGLGFALNLNPKQAYVIIKNSSLQCLGSAIFRAELYSPLAIHVCSEGLLVHFPFICIYLQFFLRDI